MLKCDNQGAIQLAYNLLYHSKKNHLDLDAHYIQGLVTDGILSLEYCPTKQQEADIFTKSLNNREVYTYSSFTWDEGSCHQGGSNNDSFLHLLVGFSSSHY